MKKTKRILPLLLAFVMCVTSVLPVYATEADGAVPQMTVATLTTNDGSGLIEAEDTSYSDETDKISKDELVTGTDWVLRMREWYGVQGTTPTLSSYAVEDNTSEVSFNVDVDMAGTYYIWARSSYYSSDNGYIWLSVNRSDYAKTSIMNGNTNKSTQLTSGATSGIYGWAKIAEVEVTDTESDVEVRIKPIRVRGTNAKEKIGYAAAIDKFVVTNAADFTPTDDTTLPDTEASNTYGVTINTQESGKDPVVTTGTEASKGTAYTYTLPIEESYAFSVTSVTIDGAAYTGYSLENGILTINGDAITGAIVITLNKVSTETPGGGEESIATLNTNQGSGLIEAEDTSYSDDTDKIFKEELVTDTNWVLRMREWYGVQGTTPTLSSYAVEDNTSEVSFNVDVDMAGTYYIWARSSYYSSDNGYIWLSVNRSDYAKTSIMNGNTNKSTQLTNGATKGIYGWVKIAEVEVTDTSSDVEVRIKPIRVRAEDKIGYAAAVDKFVVTNTADFTPTDIKPTPDTVTYDVTLPEGCTSVSGYDFVAENTDFAFKISDNNWDYVFSATMDGNETTVTNNGDGTYTISNVTGALVITAQKTGKTYSVTVTTQETDKDDVVTNAANATYGTDYIYTLPTEEGHTYRVTGVTIDGTEYSDYTETNGVLTIPGNALTGAVAITMLKTDANIVIYAVTVDENLQYGTYTCATTAEGGKSYVLTITPDSSNPCTYTVSATMGGTSVELVKNAEANTYTINEVTGDVAFTIEEVRTFTSSDGSALFEAEATSYSDDTDKIFKEELVTNTDWVLRMREWYGEQGTTPTLSSYAVEDNTSEVSFNVDVDMAGTYYIWARSSFYSSDNGYIWLSINGSDYAKTSIMNGDTNKNTQLNNGATKGTYGWKKIAEVEVTDTSSDVEVRIKPIRVRAEEKIGYAAAVDKFIITVNSYYSPVGKDPITEGDLPASNEVLVQTLPSDAYAMPEVIPPEKTHPRVMFTAQDIETIKENLTHPENKEAYDKFIAFKDQNYEGNLPVSTGDNYDAEGIAIIESKAFDYVINGKEENGEAAIAALKNYLKTYTSVSSSTNYRNAGHVLFVAAEVYDWCYDLLDEAEKQEIVARCQNISFNYLEVGFPPSLQGNITSHGSEAQILRDWMALAIATYDEYPDIYNYVAGRYYQEYVPARNYFYESGGHYQGNNYGPYRFTWDLWAQLLISNMSKTDGVESTLVEETSQVPYQWIYTRRPDGELLREGDDAAERSDDISGWYSYTNYVFFLASNFYEDGVLKKEFLDNNTGIPDRYLFDNVTAVQMLALNNPDIETEEKEEFPLTKYISSPIGAMVARTGWNMGVGSPDVLAYMKIGEVLSMNHQHRDAGNFQIYYKGILASESGAYMEYSDNHNLNYNQSSIAHNTLSITSEANPTGVQRLPNKYSDKNIGSEYKTISDLKNDPASVTGEVIGQEFGPDTYAPEYTYIAGDIASAYDDNVKEAVRSMLFMPLEDEEHPAAFVVFDRITTAEANSTKTFMLHMQSKPTINGNVTNITNTDENNNGMLTNQTLLPANASIEAIGGKGQAFMVGDTNYEPSSRFSLKPIEEGWGRVEISTTTAAENQTDYFLNVMYVNDADQTLDLEEAELIEATNVVGAKIFDRVAMFNKEKTRTGAEITFTIPEDADVISYKVNVAGLQDGTWTITTSNGTQTAVATVDGGIVYFDAPAGTCTLTRTGDENTKDFTSNKPDVEDAGFDIKVNGRYLYTTVEPEKNGEETYLPVKALFGVAYSTITENADGSVAIDHLGIKIDVAGNGATATLADGTQVKTTDVKAKDGEFLVPASFLSQALGDKIAIEWNELTQLVEVTIEEVVKLEAYDWSDTYPNAIKPQVPTQFDNTEEAAPIWNALDGDFGTRWAAEGLDGTETGIFDLGKVYKLDKILLAFYQGNARTAAFAIEVSTDGVNYTEAIGKTTTSGKTLELEAYDMGNVEARYVKLLGYGCKDGTNAWNSILEIVFLGEAVSAPEATPTPEPDSEGTIVVTSTDVSFALGTNNKVIIRCSGEYKEFMGIDMDGKEVDESNYTTSEGSTIVEFKTEYLETLSVGSHMVTLRYTNGRSASSELTILAKTGDDALDDTDNSNKDDSGADDFADSDSADITVAAGSTATGDNSNVILWSMVMAFALLGIAIIINLCSKYVK